MRFQHCLWTVPALAPGQYPVSLTAVGGTIVLPDTLTVTAGVSPLIESITPSVAAGGTVTVTGQGFTGVTAAAIFRVPLHAGDPTYSAPNTANTGTSADFTVPSFAPPGEYKLQIYVTDCGLAESERFQVN